MAKFDIESFRNTFVTLMQAQMAAKLTAITTEKGDSLSLPTFDAAQYTSDLNETVMNFNSFIFYSFPSLITTKKHASKIAMTITMSFEVVLVNYEGGDIANNQILRYTRAMQEIISEYATRDSNISDLDIEILAPTPINALAGSGIWRVGGISITGVITT